MLDLSGLTHVIWLEGINDLGGLHSTDAIIDGYKDVVSRLHAAGVKVYGATITSALGVFGVPFPTGDNGPVARPAGKCSTTSSGTPGSSTG